ncbi:MAG: hypothetical protein ACR5LC_11710 [Symbiopectobacterium sp.]|uniref:hypothetical protein n=1 Tax=Symbiopectobacterium sp. TaxID=2952789 RepID=UPI003F337468
MANAYSLHIRMLSRRIDSRACLWNLALLGVTLVTILLVLSRGAPQTILTETLIKTVFDLDSRIIADPAFGTPLCIPLGRYAPKQQSLRHA